MIRVLVVDDHSFVRASLVAVLDAAADIEVVGSGADGREVPELARATRPHVVVMDLNMPGVAGVQATTELGISHPMIRVLVLTGSTNRHAMAEAARAGAAGYLYKGGDPNVLVQAVRAVASGGSAWPGRDSEPKRKAEPGVTL